MKKLLCLLLALLMVFSMVACGAKEEAPAPAPEAPAEEAAPEKEEAPAEEAPAEEEAPAADKNMDLNILWAGTGNGEMANEAAAILEAQGVNVSLEYNTVAHEVFQPMLVAGNPPDVVMVQDNFFDHFAAAASGAYIDVTEYLSLPVGDKTVYDLAYPSVIDSIKMDGATYFVPAAGDVLGICYNKALFEEHGWEVPETIDDFMALCEEIKTTTDIAPFAYTGMYPYYFDAFIWPVICSYGNGAETYKDFNNLEEGWWLSEPVTKAFNLVQEIRDKGYFVDGMMGMNHTGSQMEFINGNIAMICVGSWLEVEMDGNWPEGFELGAMHTPTVEAGGEHYLNTTCLKMVFPKDATNTDLIGEFLQSYFSEDSAAYNAGNGCVIAPAYVADSEKVSGQMSAFSSEIYTNAAEAVNLYPLAKGWYKEWWDTYQNNLTALVSGEVDAPEFCQMMEDATEELRNDDSIVKYTAG